MFIAELFDVTPPEDNFGKVELNDLDHVPEKAYGILHRLAQFHQVRDLNFDRRKHKWFAADSEGINPFMRDAKHITSAAGMGVALLIYRPNQFNYQDNCQKQ